MIQSLMLLASGFLLGNEKARILVSNGAVEVVKQTIDALNGVGDANVQTPDVISDVAKKKKK